jgi:SAM-dependent methyltransferase
MDVVERMLEIAGVSKDDTVYDLGCGDGRIVNLAAKKYGARGVGVDLDPYRVALSQSNANKLGVEGLVEFKVADVFTTDISAASVVTLYLLHWSTLALSPVLTSQLAAGSRIVSHGRDLGGWIPNQLETYVDLKGTPHTIYLWVVNHPWNVE